MMRCGAETIARRGAVLLIAGYRAIISPWLTAIIGPACRYTPTCSEYAREAIAEYGIGRGGWIALKRIARCRPGSGWGYDPVAPCSSDSEIDATTSEGLGPVARPAAKPSA